MFFSLFFYSFLFSLFLHYFYLFYFSYYLYIFIFLFRDEVIDIIRDYLSKSNITFINTWWYSDSICHNNFIQLGDSIEQTLTGINHLLINNNDIQFIQDNISLCIIGYNKKYTNNLYKLIKNNMLYIRYNPILITFEYQKYYDENSIEIIKIQNNCMNSFIISDLYSHDLVIISKLIKPKDNNITFILLKIDESVLIAMNQSELFNNSYIITSYFNSLENEANRQLHIAMEEYSIRLNLSHLNVFYYNNTYLIQNHVINSYIGLLLLRDFSGFDLKTYKIQTPKGDYLYKNIKAIPINKISIIHYYNEILEVINTSDLFINAYYLFTFNKDGKIQFPLEFCILKDDNILQLEDSVERYKCSVGYNLKLIKTYHLLILYDSNNINDYFHIIALQTAIYEMSEIYLTDIVYIIIIYFII